MLAAPTGTFSAGQNDPYPTGHRQLVTFGVAETFTATLVWLWRRVGRSRFGG
jgi:hypothetical protein